MSFAFSSYLISPKKLKTWYEKGFVVPLVLPLELDCEPWEIAKEILHRNPCAFFLDSGRFQEKTARYSYVGWNPFRIFRCRGAVTALKKSGGTPSLQTYHRIDDKTALTGLRGIFRAFRARKWPEFQFFTSGAVGYFSYELARAFERLPDYSKNDLKIDQIALIFSRNLFVFDH